LGNAHVAQRRPDGTYGSSGFRRSLVEEADQCAMTRKALRASVLV
jgi:hypothetical protein